MFTVHIMISYTNDGQTVCKVTFLFCNNNFTVIYFFFTYYFPTYVSVPGIQPATPVSNIYPAAYWEMKNGGDRSDFIGFAVVTGKLTEFYEFYEFTNK